MGGLTQELIAVRVAKELREGMYVNVGFGMPILVPQFVPDKMEVIFQTENGILDLGMPADEANMDFDLIDARATPVTLRSGAAFFDSALSFVMIRGGHIDVSILGAYQVSESGDLANWRKSSVSADESLKGVMGNIGGAMDLAIGAKEIWVMMEHTTSSGEPKILKECSYALTAQKVVKLIFTNLCMIEVTTEGLVVKEVAPGISPEEVQKSTDAELLIGKDVKEMRL